jgi:hypothetical protein
MRTIRPFAAALSKGRHQPSRRFSLLAIAAWTAAIALFASPLPAESISFQAATPGRSALATFSLTGHNLDISLSNTYSNGADFQFTQTDVLSALFFDVAGTPTLGTVDAMLLSGSTVRLNGPDITTAETGGQPLGIGDIGAAWAFKSGALPGLSQHYGITAVGFSIFGTHDLFHPDTTLPHQQGTAPNGEDYGLMPLLTTNYTYANFSKRAFIQGGVTLRLSGFSGSLEDIGYVRFQYGSSLTSPSVEPTAEPSTLTLLIVGVAGTLAFAWRKW